MRVIRTAFLLGALTLFLMLVGQYVGGRNGMTLGLGIAICTNAFAYFFSDKIALLSSGARPVSREELPRLYAVMERLAAKANLPVPKLYVIPEAAPNAFATGRNPRHASVAVTEGLLQLGHPRIAPVFSGAPRRTAAAARSFAPARVLCRRNGRADGWPALRLDECAPKAGGLQPADTHNHAFPVDLRVVHREAVLRRRRLVLTVQHPSPA